MAKTRLSSKTTFRRNAVGVLVSSLMLVAATAPTTVWAEYPQDVAQVDLADDGEPTDEWPMPPLPKDFEYAAESWIERLAEEIEEKDTDQVLLASFDDDDGSDVLWVAQQPRRSTRPARRRPSTSRPPSSREAALAREAVRGFGGGLAFSTRTPSVIGDLFGGASRVVTITDTVAYSFHTYGNIIVGSPGSSTAALVFERDGIPPFNDFTTQGLGTDASGDGQADTFAMSEPLPPNDVPTSPGPGFVYQPGTVVYTNSSALTTAQNGQFMNGDIWFANYSYARTTTIQIPGNSGLAVRRVKVAENNSPEPRDRLYFDYKFFRDVIGGFGDVNRYTFGFEKTFYQQLLSVDVRLPFAMTLSNQQIAEATAARDFLFGNLTVILKGALYYDESILVSSGMGVAVPTGRDTNLFMPDGRLVLTQENESVHLLPFAAWMWVPNDRYYLQSFLQLDIDANGNPVRGGLNGGLLPGIGRLQDANLLFVDLSGGYYVYTNPDDSAWLQRVATIAELHYSTTVQPADLVTDTGLSITDTTRRLDVLNVTTGLNLDLGDQHTLTAAFVFPLRNGDDRQFDYELAVLANWYF